MTTQNGNNVTIFDISTGVTYTGSVNGASYTVSATYSEKGGTTKETINFTLTSSISAYGNVVWTWTEPGYSCNGAADLTLQKQSDTNATFDWGVVISEYRHYEPPFTTSDSYYMLCAAGVNTNEYPVYVQNIPNTSGDTFLYYISGWDDINQDYTYARTFMSPAPGLDWENKTYIFYVDIIQNGLKDQGEPTIIWNIPQGYISQMALVQNVSISDGYNPTITWDPAPNADTYRIRFVPIKDGNPDFNIGLFQSDEFSGSSSYSFTYTGNLFKDYGPIAIVIEAWEDYNDFMINRSRYIIQHDPCKKSMPWIPLLLLDD